MVGRWMWKQCQHWVAILIIVELMKGTCLKSSHINYLWYLYEVLSEWLFFLTVPVIPVLEHLSGHAMTSLAKGVFWNCNAPSQGSKFSPLEQILTFQTSKSGAEMTVFDRSCTYRSWLEGLLFAVDKVQAERVDALSSVQLSGPHLCHSSTAGQQFHVLDTPANCQQAWGGSLTYCEKIYWESFILKLCLMLIHSFLGASLDSKKAQQRLREVQFKKVSTVRTQYMGHHFRRVRHPNYMEISFSRCNRYVIVVSGAIKTVPLHRHAIHILWQ